MESSLGLEVATILALKPAERGLIDDNAGKVDHFAV
jgi:hypothetical protein